MKRFIVVLLLPLAAALLFIAAVFASPIISIAFAGAGQSGTTATATPAPSSTPGSCVTTVHYGVKDTDKEFRYALANPAGTDADSTFDELKDAAYADPIRAATTVAPVDRDFGSINNRPPYYSANHPIWCEEVGAALDKLSAITPVIENVDAGSWTLVAVPTSGLDENVPASIYQMKTTRDYQAAVYRFDTYTVKFLLDGGFSPVRSTRFDDVPVVPKAAKPSASASSPAPSASASSAGSSAGMANHDPHHNGGADQGGGTNTGLQGSEASQPSGSPPATRRTNPPRPSASSASSGGSGGSGSSPAPSRTNPPAPSASPSASGESNCVVVPGVEACEPL